MPTHPLDPRINPFRPDLAAEALRGRAAAPRFAEPVPRRVIASLAPLRRAPSPEAPLETQALFGEAVDVFDEDEGWAWVQLARDGYVGYLPAADLAAPRAATHIVTALRTHAYPAPSIKAPPALALPMGALLAVEREQAPFLALADGLYVYAAHAAPLPARAPDFVAVAERFLNAPYLWGGRSSEGVDCSGLAQGALRMAGLAAPRDADMLEAAVGVPLDPAARDLRRGDLVFWSGHVGIMRDASTLLHASGHHMMVVGEPLAEAAKRTQEKGGGEVTSIRRPEF